MRQIQHAPVKLNDTCVGPGGKGGGDFLRPGDLGCIRRKGVVDRFDLARMDGHHAGKAVAPGAADIGPETAMIVEIGIDGVDGRNGGGMGGK